MGGEKKKLEAHSAQLLDDASATAEMLIILKTKTGNETEKIE